MDLRETARIQVHIEELVLEGFAQRDRYAIAEALERELSRLLREQGVPARLLRARRPHDVDAGQVRVGNAAHPAAVGTHAARAIHRGLGR